MKSPILSIIVPVFNKKDELSVCIDSILNQTFRNFELIIINDGSSDGSGQICDNYQQTEENRIKVIHQVNQGVSVARNTGLKIAAGEYITFIDSDDYVGETFLSNFFPSTEEKDVDIIFQGFTEVIEGKHKKRNYQEPNYGKPLELFYILDKLHMYGFIWCKLFKKSIIEEFDIAFNPQFPFMEDHLFILEYCKYITSAKYIDRHDYFYKSNINGLSRKILEPNLTFSIYKTVFLQTQALIVKHDGNKTYDSYNQKRLFIHIIVILLRIQEKKFFLPYLQKRNIINRIHRFLKEEKRNIHSKFFIPFHVIFSMPYFMIDPLLKLISKVK